MLIHETVALAGAAGTRLGGAEGVGLVVLALVVLPATELVLPLNVDRDHGWTADIGIVASCRCLGTPAPANDGWASLAGALFQLRPQLGSWAAGRNLNCLELAEPLQATPPQGLRRWWPL